MAYKRKPVTPEKPTKPDKTGGAMCKHRVPLNSYCKRCAR